MEQEAGWGACRAASAYIARSRSGGGLQEKGEMSTSEGKGRSEENAPLATAPRLEHRALVHDRKARVYMCKVAREERLLHPARR